MVTSWQGRSICLTIGFLGPSIITDYNGWSVTVLALFNGCSCSVIIRFIILVGSGLVTWILIIRGCEELWELLLDNELEQDHTRLIP